MEGLTCIRFCLSQLKRASVNMSFSTTDLIVSCLTLTNWTYLIWTEVLVHLFKSVNSRKTSRLSAERVFLKSLSEVTKATCGSHLDTWKHPQSETKQATSAKLKGFSTGSNLQCYTRSFRKKPVIVLLIVGCDTHMPCILLPDYVSWGVYWT